MHAFAAAATSLLIASCSTSPDGQASFALSNPALSSDAATTDDTANGVAPEATAVAADSSADHRAGAGNSALPAKVAYLPPAKPGAAFPKAGLAASAESSADANTAVKADATAAATAGQEPAAKEQILTASPPSPRNEQVMTAANPAAAEPAPKKRSFLASLFSANQAAAAPVRTQKPETQDSNATTAASVKPEAPKAASQKPEPAPLVKLASTEPSEQLAISRGVTGSYGSDALPGVRKTELFEIKRKSGLDDDSDVDLHEEDDIGPIRVASAAGLARLAPNGLLKQTDRVDTACLKPALVRTLKQMERHFGRKVVITSGYRSASYNRQVRGAKNSQHMYCAAADIQIPGVSKWEVANFARSLPGRGGVGTYCHTESVHVDVGPERDWNWRCRRGKA
ncbi:YcbK family protein [Arvimicrobium flavum]|uniref:YcbK family protein n=1 Tax=Arvimicrobium flavum TaxID=3393320 RepID=UPI00237BC98E|nr:YcbK family protein [Mesorhizobium shangrilense]